MIAPRKEVQRPEDLFEATPEGRVDFFGDLQVRAREAEVFADPNDSDAPRKKIRTVATAAQETAALQGETLQLVEALYDELARERGARRDLERRVSRLEGTRRRCPREQPRWSFVDRRPEGGR